MKSLQVAYSTNAFARYSLGDALSAIKRLGFDGVELVADAPHLFMPKVLETGHEPCRGARVPDVALSAPPRSTAATRPFLQEVLSLLQAHPLAVSNVNANTARGGPEDNAGWTLSDLDVKSRRRAIEHVCGAIELAASVGAPSISVAGGSVSAHASAKNARRLFLRSLHDILAHASSRNIRVGIEAEPGLAVSTTSDVEWCLAQIRNDRLGANLDVGHCVVAGETPAESIRRVAGRIWHVHIEDIQDKTHRHLVPGRGGIDFRAVFRALAEAKYEGFVTLELYTYPHDPEGAGKAGLAHLRPLLESRV